MKRIFLSVASYFALSAVFIYSAWWIRISHLYKSGDMIGYNLGLVGGILMLILLTYPLRKRFNFMSRLGEMKSWFSFHMFCGIAGPVLIFYHSAFHLGSMNAQVAFYSMLVVALSGFVGRYAYRRIHWGMFGRLQDLTELESELLGREDLAQAKFREYPAIIDLLRQFRNKSLKKNLSTSARFFEMLRFPLERDRVRREAKSLLPSEGASLDALASLIDDYAFAVDRYVTFTFYEKLFALWHVIHIPLVYILFASAVWHVIAVHMY